MRTRSTLLLVLSFLLGCSKPAAPPRPADIGVSTGPRITKLLGASGGSIATTDGRLTLEFPMGALGADTEVGIEPITNTAPLGRGAAYRLTPDGAMFTQPVKLVLKVAATDLAGSSKEALAVGYQDQQGFWRAWKKHDVDAQGSTVTTETTHFTDVSMLLGWQLKPEAARIAPLDTLELRLTYCEPELYDDELSGLIPSCEAADDELPRLVTVNQWAVNGKGGGTLGDGIIDGKGRLATYTAPGEEPSPNPVAVSCEFARTQGKQLAVANVTVSHPGWKGTVSWTLTGTKDQTVGTTHSTWKGMGSGMISVKPGPFDTIAVDQASATYSYQFDEQVNNTFMQNGCMHVLDQHRTETLTGTSTAEASIFVSPDGMGSTVLLFAVPSGPTTGTMKVDATDTVTGPAPCSSGMPTHTTTASSGTMPSDSPSITIAGAPEMLVGSTQVHFDGQPPRDYAVSWSISK